MTTWSRKLIHPAALIAAGRPVICIFLAQFALFAAMGLWIMITQTPHPTGSHVLAILLVSAYTAATGTLAVLFGAQAIR